MSEHTPERTYSLAELRDHCITHGHLAEAERLELYEFMQRDQEADDDE